MRGNTGHRKEGEDLNTQGGAATITYRRVYVTSHEFAEFFSDLIRYVMQKQ